MNEPVPSGDLCLGGSFDPIHVGHLQTARAAVVAAGFARVRLIVAGRSPFKSASVTPAANRVAMCRIAIADQPDFVVDDRETRRDGPSYTADTAEAIAAETGRPTAWLIGADLLPGLPRWHRADELLSKPPTILQHVVMRRPGYMIDWDTLPRQVRHLRDHVVEVPAVDVSSTLVRQRVAAGEPIDDLVPPGVAAYIANNGLYREVASA